MNELLFPPKRPESQAVSRPINQEYIQWCDTSINELQKQAVVCALERPQYSPPLIIFGPPGTGKTVTMIESILQVTRHHPRARILAVAPSDPAADILASRLYPWLTRHEMIRMNLFSRKVESVSPELLQYCVFEPGQDLFKLPSTQALESCQVLVTTTLGSGLLPPLGISTGFFDYLFMDEAAQATEPETVLALSVVGPQARIILTGDPQQLGANCHSEQAKELGLHISYQERLMCTWTEVYMQPKEEEDRRLPHLIKLVQNYRSHPKILTVSSRLFYQNELVPVASRETSLALEHWTRMPQRPCVFCGLYGQEAHGLDSPSYYNISEASKIADFVQELLSSSDVEVNTRDIGVISFFRHQVLVLRDVFRRRDLGAINIGTVEHFQGQEQKVILISTVLTSVRHDRSVVEKISNPKRFNVAMTRAQALLLVVGHPVALAHEPLWRHYIDYCVNESSFIGTSEAILESMQISEQVKLEDISNDMGALGRGDLESMYATDLDTFYAQDSQSKVHFDTPAMI